MSTPIWRKALVYSLCFAAVACSTPPDASKSDGQKIQNSKPAAPVYASVSIGEQQWMAKNLHVSTFRNGESIPQANSREELEQMGEARMAAWCYPGFDPALGAKYGHCYNWHAVNDPRGLAPEGWRIPTATDWDALATTQGGADVAGVALKSGTGWYANANGTNSSGFNALPSGAVSVINGYMAETKVAVFWTASPGNTGPSFAQYRVLHAPRRGVYAEEDVKFNAFPVRCIRP